MQVHHRPYSFEDGPVVYPTNAFDSRQRGDYTGTAWFKSDKISKINKKKTFSGWWPTIAFLYLFLSHFLLRLTSFISQKQKQKKKKKEEEEEEEEGNPLQFTQNCHPA